jgi:hypothetical protein
MQRFPQVAPIGIRVDSALNRARRIVARLTASKSTNLAVIA